MNLRPYQDEAIDAALGDLIALDRVLLVIGTGGGKTVIAGEIARRFIPVGNVLFLADAKTLVDQAADKMGKVCGIPAKIVMGQKTTAFPGDSLVVGTTQSMARRLTAWPRNSFSLIMIDEAHRNCMGAQAQAVLGHFSSAQVIGLTATPERSGPKQLGHFFQKISCDIGLVRLIKEGYLARIKIRSIPCPVDLSAVKRSKINGEKDLRAEDVALAMAPHIAALAEMLAKNYEGRKTVGFVPLISTSKDLAAACRGLGLRAVHVDGTDRDALSAFTTGEADIVLNSSLLTTGWDHPELACVAMMRPTESFSLYSQMIGRGTRLFPGKDHLLVLDPLWQGEKMNLVRPFSLATDAPIPDTAETVDLLEVSEAAEEADRLKKLKEEVEKSAKRKVKEFDPFGNPVEEVKKPKGIAADFFADELKKWVIHVPPQWIEQPPQPEQIAALEKAGLATEGLTRAKAAKLLDIISARRWQGLATPKQINILKRFGVKDLLSITFEKASALLDEKFSSKKST